MHPLALEGVCSNVLNQQMWIVFELTCLKAIRNAPGLCSSGGGMPKTNQGNSGKEKQREQA